MGISAKYRAKATEACLFATKHFGMSPQEINSGRCFHWASIVFEKLEGSKIAGHNLNGCGHTWIEYAGFCYDAEVPEGIRNWLDLPFWKRIKAEAGTKEFNKEVRRATQ